MNTNESNKPKEPDNGISIVVLTYNRPEYLKNLVKGLANITYRPFELIIVDNHSEKPVEALIKQYDFVTVIRMDSNMGVGGRNKGLERAKGSIIITLDDDVFGITDDSIAKLLDLFKDPLIAAACFKVLDASTAEVINWCHHYKVEEYADKQFLTNEITEGAVAFRRDVLEMTGYYPERFFISHEGPDLAFRIMNVGYNVVYTPEIEVQHYHAVQGRPNWRRHYYDTRNLIWLVLRNHGFITGFARLSLGLTAMLVYSLRDGFFRYWIKAVVDGLMACPEVWKERTPMSQRTNELNRHINSFRPGFFYMVKKRLFSKKIRI